MANATTKHAVKQRVLEARRAEKAAREAREAAIVDGLSEFLAEVDRAAAVGAKLEGQVAAARAKALERVERIEQETEERIAKLTEAAREETARCERAAGEAVMRLREQGETVTAIASQTGQSHNRVRELGKLATTAQGATEVVPMGSADASGASEDAESAGVNAEEPDVVPVAASDGAGDGVGAEEPAVDAATSLSA
ncbi:MAG: hypothetical protein AB7U97_01410 [Pirellulales bacterium]